MGSKSKTQSNRSGQRGTLFYPNRHKSAHDIQQALELQGVVGLRARSIKTAARDGEPIRLGERRQPEIIQQLAKSLKTFGRIEVA